MSARQEDGVRNAVTKTASGPPAASGTGRLRHFWNRLRSPDRRRVQSDGSLNCGQTATGGQLGQTDGSGQKLTAFDSGLVVDYEQCPPTVITIDGDEGDENKLNSPTKKRRPTDTSLGASISSSSSSSSSSSTCVSVRDTAADPSPTPPNDADDDTATGTSPLNHPTDPELSTDSCRLDGDDDDQSDTLRPTAETKQQSAVSDTYSTLVPPPLKTAATDGANPPDTASRRSGVLKFRTCKQSSPPPLPLPTTTVSSSSVVFGLKGVTFAPYRRSGLTAAKPTPPPPATKPKPTANHRSRMTDYEEFFDHRLNGTDGATTAIGSGGKTAASTAAVVATPPAVSPQMRRQKLLQTGQWLGQSEIYHQRQRSANPALGDGGIGEAAFQQRRMAHLRRSFEGALDRDEDEGQPPTTDSGRFTSDGGASVHQSRLPYRARPPPKSPPLYSNPRGQSADLLAEEAALAAAARASQHRYYQQNRADRRNPLYNSMPRLNLRPTTGDWDPEDGGMISHGQPYKRAPLPSPGAFRPTLSWAHIGPHHGFNRSSQHFADHHHHHHQSPAFSIYDPQQRQPPSQQQQKCHSDQLPQRHPAALMRNIFPYTTVYYGGGNGHPPQRYPTIHGSARMMTGPHGSASAAAHRSFRRLHQSQCAPDEMLLAEGDLASYRRQFSHSTRRAKYGSSSRYPGRRSEGSVLGRGGQPRIYEIFQDDGASPAQMQQSQGAEQMMESFPPNGPLAVTTLGGDQPFFAGGGGTVHSTSGRPFMGTITSLAAANQRSAMYFGSTNQHTTPAPNAEQLWMPANQQPPPPSIPPVVTHLADLSNSSGSITRRKSMGKNCMLGWMLAITAVVILGLAVALFVQVSKDANELNKLRAAVAADFDQQQLLNNGENEPFPLVTAAPPAGRGWGRARALDNNQFGGS